MLQKQFHACQRNNIFVFAERLNETTSTMNVLVLCRCPLVTKAKYAICFPLLDPKDSIRVLKDPEKWLCTFIKFSDLKPVSLMAERRMAQMRIVRAAFFSPEVNLINLEPA